MKISLTSSIDELRPAARNLIRTLLLRTFARFNSRIDQVSVSIIDDNGPRGGADKVCRITVRMPGLGMIVATSRHQNFMAAVSEAAQRARKIVVTKLKRPRSLRRRNSFRNINRFDIAAASSADESTAMTE